MRAKTEKLAVLGVLLASVLIAACTAPTGPRATRLARTLALDVGDSCDSTIITDGSCRGGFIIPH